MDKEFEVLEDLSKQEIIVKKGIGIYMDGSVQTMPHKTTVGVEFKGYIEALKQAIIELKQIKEAKPGEALEIVNDFDEHDKITEFDVVSRNSLYYYQIDVDCMEIIKQALIKAQEDKQFIELVLNKPQLLNVFAFDGVHTWEEFEDIFSDEDKEYINTTKEEFEYMRNQLIKRGKING